MTGPKGGALNTLLILLCLLLLASNLYLLVTLRREISRDRTLPPAPSVGEQAGEMYKGAQSQLRQSSQVVKAQAEETARVLRQESEKSAVTLEQAWNDFVRLVNQELEKFRQTLHQT